MFEIVFSTIYGCCSDFMCCVYTTSKDNQSGGERMKNNSNESRIFELVGKIVIKEAEKKMAEDSYWWPPACAGFLHQPKRPTKEVK